MATIQCRGQRNVKGELWADLAFARPELQAVAQVGDRIEDHSLGVALVVAAVRRKGTRVYYTPVEGSVSVIGPDAAEEEERLGGSVPRLSGDRFE